MDTLEKSARKPQRASNVDAANASTAQVSDVNVSGVSGTPASDAGDSTATRRTRRNAPSLPSLLEIPPTIADNDEQMVLMTSSGEEVMPPSNSNEEMVRSDILILILVFLFIITFYLWYGDSALTLSVGRQEGHPTRKKYGGIVSPHGVAPSRMVCMSASVNLPLHHKVQKSSSGTGSPGWSRKKGRKTVVGCGMVWRTLMFPDSNAPVAFSRGT